ncbi:MAG: Fe-S cluster assembly protein SufB [Oscillochloris sp.]|nr:Fe-S cluster assembly protein SufB [Oscillochloris sp.]
MSGDARVYTNKGLVPIQEIQPGDTVFSFDEETNRIIPAEVRATARKGEREVFEVRVGTRTIKATSNHPFLALTYQKDEDRVRGRYARSWKYLHELVPGDLVAVAKDLPDTGVLYVLQQPEIKTHVEGRNQSVSYDLNIAGRYNQVRLPEYTTEELMWWLGLYIGDGFIHSTAGADKARVEIAIPATDSELRTELIRVCEELFDLTPMSSDPYRVSLNSTTIARFLEANGFAGKALTKRVPSWVFGLPQSQKLAFLGGYLDSDGYVRDTDKNHDIMLTSGNRDLLQDMTELLVLCGLPTSSIHRFESKHPQDQERMVTGYRVQVAGDYERIGSRSPNRLGRMSKRKHHHDYSSAKGTTFRSHVTEFHGYVKIDSITPAGVDVVYDIEVDGPHNFVAEGLIVHNSEVVYHSLREEWQKLGVIFLDTDTALKEHPEIFKQYFGTVIPSADNKYAALNTAVWSGGSFVYVPAGVKVDIPLQAYFRINAENMGQFERTLIILEEGAEAHYIEGCTAPIYSTNSLHSAVVEIILNKGAKFRYTTIQNWANNIFNLVTKRAVAHEEASMEWVDGNIGSKLTMKYPSVYLMGRKARGEVLSVAYAGKGQHQDAGAKMVHIAPETTSRITNKSVSKDGGKTTYRGLAKVAPGAYGAKINVNCDALILDERSASDTIPYIEIEEDRCTLAHEATVGRIGAEQLFYLMSRGLKEADALSMIVLGFMEPFTRELPMEYAVELNRLIQMEMEGSVG